MANGPPPGLLEQVGRDLVAAARAAAFRRPWGRDRELHRALERLDRGHGSMIVGEKDTGRHALVHGIALAMAARGRGGLFEICAADLLSPLDGQAPPTTTAAVIRAAVELGAVLYLPDLPLLTQIPLHAGTSSSIWRLFAPYVESGRLRVLCTVTPSERAALSRVPGVLHSLRPIELGPIPQEAVQAAIQEAAQDLGLRFAPGVIQHMIHLSDRVSGGRPQPAVSIDSLAAVADFIEDQPGTPGLIDPALVEAAISDATGLPPHIVAPAAGPSDLAPHDWLSERVLGQPAAVTATASMLQRFRSGLSRPNGPAGSGLLYGPRGTGRRSLARAIATWAYGGVDRLVHVDLRRPPPSNGLSRSISAWDLLRADHYQTVLIDGITEADPRWVAAVQAALDTGWWPLDNGDRVDVRSCLLLARLDAPVPATRPAGQPPAPPHLPKRAGPLGKLLSTFQAVLHFQALDPRDLRAVVRRTLQEFADEEGISARGWRVHPDDDALDHIVALACHPGTGARDLPRALEDSLALPLSLETLSQAPQGGGLVHVRLSHDQLTVQRHHASVPAPSPGRVTTARDQLDLRTRACRRAVTHLAQSVGETALLEEQALLLNQRQLADFWRQTAQARGVLAALDRVTVGLDRLSRLRSRVAAVEELLRGADTHGRVQRGRAAVLHLEDVLSTAWLELVYMGEDGHWDALVELTPEGPAGTTARDLMLSHLTAWAQHRSHRLRTLSADAGGATLVAIQGRYAFGALALEAGRHQLGDATGAAIMRVAPWTDARADATRVSISAGPAGSRLRTSTGLTLDGADTTDLRQLADELDASWDAAPPAPETEVRRYWDGGLRWHDMLTGIREDGAQATSPARYDTLLRQRVEHTATTTQVARENDRDTL